MAALPVKPGRYELFNPADGTRRPIDEAMAGFATKVDVRILEDGGVQVTDDGRGIPVAEGSPRARDPRGRGIPAPG